MIRARVRSRPWAAKKGRLSHVWYRFWQHWQLVDRRSRGWVAQQDSRVQGSGGLGAEAVRRSADRRASGLRKKQFGNRSQRYFVVRLSSGRDGAGGSGSTCEYDERARRSGERIEGVERHVQLRSLLDLRYLREHVRGNGKGSALDAAERRRIETEAA